MAAELEKSPGYENVFIGKTQEYKQVSRVRDKFQGNNSNVFANDQQCRETKQKIMMEERRGNQLVKDSMGTENVKRGKHEKNQKVNPGFKDKTFSVNVEFDKNGNVI